MEDTLLPNDMKDCITTCWDCRTLCHQTLYDHCLPMGGRHTEAEHIKAMMDCIDICQVAADFMTRNSPSHRAVCAACAEVCYDCAESCEKVGGDEMLACAQLCRECAEMCDDMSLSAIEEGLLDRPSETPMTLV